MSNADISIALNNIALQYPLAAAPILEAFSMDITANQWTCLLGRSGSGKTTLLRYLAGLLDDKINCQGELNISDGQPLAGRIAYMAQQDLLLPWLSVGNNVCLSYRLSGESVTPAVLQKARRLLRQVGLSDQFDALPQTLSGWYYRTYTSSTPTKVTYLFLT